MITSTDIDGAIEEVFGPGAVIAERTPSRYATSHPLDDVVVERADGSRTALVYKEVGTLLAGAKTAKPAFTRDPLREIEIYRGLLERVGLGTATLVASGSGWLLLEKVEGVELYQVGDLAVWAGVAEWLVGAHERFSAELTLGAEAPWRRRLLRLDGASLQRWVDRAAAFLADTPNGAWAARLRDRYDQVAERLVALPQTVLHGELYPSNVIVGGPPERGRVCLIDWETASVGPALLDLAALISGRWSEEDRAAVAAPYLDAAAASVPDLDACRLHVAVQWLGWAPGWRPPADHAHDWLNEAQVLADSLQLL